MVDFPASYVSFREGSPFGDILHILFLDPVYHWTMIMGGGITSEIFVKMEKHSQKNISQRYKDSKIYDLLVSMFNFEGVDRVDIRLFTGFYTCQVVQDLSHLS